MDLNWPRKNEQLFKTETDFENNACLMSSSFAQYGEHYKEAADALITSAINRNIYVDRAVYPAVFMYRQYLELTLKDIIWRTRRIEHDGQGFPKIHSLDCLWSEAKRLLQQHYGAECPKEVEYVGQCIAEFHTYDPNSTAFRYPYDARSGSILAGLARINVRHLMETMGRIGNFLSCIASDIAERLDWCAEMERDMASECRP